MQLLAFKLWVDADALPKILREVILRASDRYQLEVTFVANQNVGITPSVRYLQSSGSSRNC